MKINDDTFAWVLHGVHAFSADAWVFARYLLFPAFALALLAANANAASTPQIISQLVSIRFLLSQLGPALSAILFIIAGIFYSVGQMLPPDKKANFHTAAINIIMGAIVVGVLSAASTSLALASTHLLNNITQSNTSV